MKILLINPPSPFLIDENVFPTLGLLYLGSYLKQAGYRDISLLDLNGKHDLPGEIKADIVGIYSNTPQFPEAVKLVKRLRVVNKAKEPLYCIGGPHVSGRPEDALQDFDKVVVGEGEMAMLDIVREKESGCGTKGGKIIKRAYMKDIDNLPFADRDLINIRDYKYYIDGVLTTTLVTSRGCPYGCNFCANNVWMKTLRMRSAANVYEEVKMLKENYGYGAFMFFDDTMTVNKKRMSDICGMLKELGIIYRCFIRSDTVDAALLEKMRSSGCVEVGMGIESGSQRILDAVRKGETVGSNMKAIKLCRELGICVKGFFIIGLPGEDHISIKETIAFLEEADLDDVDITIYKPYPGSFVYKNREKFDIDFKDDYEHAWYKGRPKDYSTTVSTKALSSSDILKFRDEIERRFKKTEAWKETDVTSPK